MLVVRMSARSAAVDDDRREFSLLGKRQVSGLALARPVTTGVRSRSVLELQQDHGGAQFRALVGGEFVPGEGDRLAWRVRHWETVRPTPQQGMLHGTLLPGLPEGLDHAAEAGLHADLNSGALPAGRLVIDRAGYDQDSSLVLFATAAELLLHILLAGAFGSPAEPIIRSWVATGRIPVALPRVDVEV
ncbi:hypothetical protein GCM10015535_41560 [Streptomyces gelaticus]|uniref:Uncharacterized protein n=1 Tax=Streptomyces gelaticus TaxID=285446 RepID=A0ABQ2W1E6_9ACTN|nr:hypothetical protein [Streptomyces gelaticus]GGV89026.1 hypothetical protein GCM10015535_41560 [Streptomyces gelaticus]